MSKRSLLPSVPLHAVQPPRVPHELDADEEAHHEVADRKPAA
jgi:hypothetical protein